MGQVDPLVRGPKWAGKAWTGKIDLSKGLPCTNIFTGNEEQERGEKGERGKLTCRRGCSTNIFTGRMRNRKGLKGNIDLSRPLPNVFSCTLANSTSTGGNGVLEKRVRGKMQVQ